MVSSRYGATGVMSSVACRPMATEPMPPPGAARWAASPISHSWSVSRQPTPSPPPPRAPRSVGGWRSWREAKAGAALSEGVELESRPIAGEGPAQPGQETFPSKEERIKAALAALDKVRADHGGTTAGATALAEIGFLKLKSGDAAGAQKDLSDFLGAAAKDHPLRPFAQESLGYAFEAGGKLDEARAAFD